MWAAELRLKQRLRSHASPAFCSLICYVQIFASVSVLCLLMSRGSCPALNISRYGQALPLWWYALLKCMMTLAAPGTGAGNVGQI